jgi:hypothetical protein
MNRESATALSNEDGALREAHPAELTDVNGGNTQNPVAGINATLAFFVNTTVPLPPPPPPPPPPPYHIVPQWIP